MDRGTSRRGLRRISIALLTTLLAAAGVATAITTAGAVATHVPIGSFERVSQAPGGLSVRGWAIDPDTTSAIYVDVYIDGRGAQRVLANRVRTDVGRTHPGYGSYHGFSVTLARPAGQHKVCVFAINKGAGRTNPLLGCRTIVLNFNPRLQIASIRQTPGGMTLAGWAFDPDTPTIPLTVQWSLDGTYKGSQLANQYRSDIVRGYPYATGYHGYTFSSDASQGAHTVCVRAVNVSYGVDTRGCVTKTLNFNPSATITLLTQSFTGAKITGWAADPDTSQPVTVVISADGGPGTSVLANRTDGAAAHAGHNFALDVPLAPGNHTVCVVAKNLLYGTGDSPKTCRAVTLNFDPIGKFDTLTRVTGSTRIRVTGWAIDPSTKGPITVAVSIDGTAAGSTTANLLRNDVKAVHPMYGAYHGFNATFATSDWEHQVCLTAINTGQGNNKSLGCRIIIAVHPRPPSAPRAVAAIGGYGSATVTWTKPSSDGGAPWSGYAITSYPSTTTVRVGATSTSAVVYGLHSNWVYRFYVSAVNVAGKSAAGVSPSVRTQSTPPPQRTPAPVSTSRYIRNIRSATSTELNTMRAEGIADARANPSGHSYVILLDIGGQDGGRGGVVLSATTRFVSYANLVKCLKYYVMGYASAQKPSAPVVVAIGTNNDMDVSSSTGAAWARSVVNPVVVFARQYGTRVRIVGANDIEPGFRATYTQTRAWLSGYLASTSAPFMFNGSADGCAWTATRRGCNNGWTMNGLYTLAAGAAPTRMVNLPQVYNYTMAAQWKYISLTGISYGHPRINFGGPLTEWTACAQARSCYSLTGHTAWTALWNELQSHTRLRIGSLPYSTDLRIDR